MSRLCLADRAASLSGRRYRGGLWPALAAVALVSGCEAHHRPAPRPRFSNGMLEPVAPLEQSRAHRGRPRRRRRARRRSSRTRRRLPWREEAARCARELVGTRLPGAKARSTRALLRRCLGRAPALGRLRRRPRTWVAHAGDVVLFASGRPHARRARSASSAAAAGLVIAVLGRRVHFVYLSGNRARRGVLDLDHPHRRRAAGRVVNSYVRPKRSTDAPGARYLAGELVSGFVTLERRAATASNAAPR